jgi:hypothetical protein
MDMRREDTQIRNIFRGTTWPYASIDGVTTKSLHGCVTMEAINNKKLAKARHIAKNYWL